MNTYETICTRRSIREFQDKEISCELLEKFVNAGRLAPQAANRQPLEFVVVDDRGLLEKFFENTKLAGYLDWKPGIKNMARAYIVVLVNTQIQKQMWASFDAALASENICLAAWEEGVGSFQREGIEDPPVVSDDLEVGLPSPGAEGGYG